MNLPFISLCLRVSVVTFSPQRHKGTKKLLFTHFIISFHQLLFLNFPYKGMEQLLKQIGQVQFRS